MLHFKLYTLYTKPLYLYFEEVLVCSFFSFTNCDTLKSSDVQYYRYIDNYNIIVNIMIIIKISYIAISPHA